VENINGGTTPADYPEGGRVIRWNRYSRMRKADPLVALLKKFQRRTITLRFESPLRVGSKEIRNIFGSLFTRKPDKEQGWDYRFPKIVESLEGDKGGERGWKRTPLKSIFL